MFILLSTNIFMFRLLYANRPTLIHNIAKGHLRSFSLIKRKVLRQEGQGCYVEVPQTDALTKIRQALGDNARSKIHNRNNAREFGAKFYRDALKPQPISCWTAIIRIYLKRMDKDKEEIY